MPVVIEGVSATDDRVPVPWDLTLWVAASGRGASPPNQSPRPDPVLLERWRTDWLPGEQAYAAAQRPWDRVDVIVSSPSEDGHDCG